MKMNALSSAMFGDYGTALDLPSNVIKGRFNKLKPTRLRILIPSGRGVWPISFAMSLQSAVTHLYENHIPGGLEFSILSRQSSTLQQSREDLVYNAAIRDGVDFLLFLDDDHTFPADVVHHLLSRFASRPDVHAIGANYVQRTLNARFITRDLNGKPVMTYPSSTGLQEVRYIGLGVAMVRGEVFRKVPEPWFDFEWSKEPGPDGRPYIERSEDVFMFDTIREHGYGCYVDHDLSKHVTHLGEFGYGYLHGLPDDYKVSILEEDDHK